MWRAALVPLLAASGAACARARWQARARWSRASLARTG